MKLFKYFMSALLMVSAVTLTGCEEDDDNQLGRKCLTSASSLNFDAVGSSEKMITVYADGKWEAEYPEWIAITPDHGEGTTDVTIAATDNVRDGAPDNPRKFTVIFKGRNLESQASLLVTQSGDKYRDCPTRKIDEVETLDNEAVLNLENALVYITAGNNFFVSDGTTNIKIIDLTNTTVAAGDIVDIMGSKLTDNDRFAYVEADKVTVKSSGNTVTFPEATDITDVFDTYASATHSMVSVQGALSGTNITVKGANNTCVLVDVPATLNISSLNGHNVRISGYYCGTAAPAVKIIPVAIEDLGANETIWFFDDFEWLAPYGDAYDQNRDTSKDGPIGDTVGDDDPSAGSPGLWAATTMVDGVTAGAALEAKGYSFEEVCAPGKNPGHCTYLNKNYLKCGKTSYQTAVTIPALTEEVPADAKPVMSFDWCSQRQGSGVIDPTQLIVIIDNNGDQQTFGPFQHGMAENAKLEWIHQEIDLTGVKLNPSTKITIRNIDEQFPISKAMRYFLDNVKISQINM